MTWLAAAANPQLSTRAVPMASVEDLTAMDEHRYLHAMSPNIVLQRGKLFR